MTPKQEWLGCVAVVLITGLLVFSTAFVFADEDTRSKAYYHAREEAPSGVIFRAAVDGLRPDRTTGLILAMLDISPSKVSGLMDCPGTKTVGVPAHWVEVGPADDPAVAATFSVIKDALTHRLIVILEVEPARNGVGESGWCRVNGATLRPRDRDKLPKRVEDR